MIAPKYMLIIAFPALWSSGTNGKIRANVIHINFDAITSVADLEQYRGKLRGRIIFISPIQEISPYVEPLPVSWTDERLDEMAKIPIRPRVSEIGVDNPYLILRSPSELSQQIVDLIFSEGAVAIAHPDSKHSFGTVAGMTRYNRVERPWDVNAPRQPTELILTVEHYNRIMHILQEDIPVEMEIDIRTSVYRGDPTDYNVIGEIPGTDLAHEIVMLGGHLQSYPHGTGAIDNGAGSVTSIEAMRILKAIGVKPRRTIRVGLWGGHDGAGATGHLSYIRQHFADPETKEYKDGYDNLVAYFNQDIGPGRVRSVSIMGNEEYRAIFTGWIKPLHSIGMSHLSTAGLSYSGFPGFYYEIGLPGFYFQHDRKEIDDWNAHTNMDMYESLFPEGMMQTAVIVATFAYHAAMRDEKLPRIAPLPW